MGRCLRVGVVVAAALLLAVPIFAQTKAKAENVPEIPIASVPNFFKLPPDLHLGEASGVAVNSKGHIFIFNRGNTIGPAPSRCLWEPGRNQAGCGTPQAWSSIWNDAPATRRRRATRSRDTGAIRGRGRASRTSEPHGADRAAYRGHAEHRMPERP